MLLWVWQRTYFFDTIISCLLGVYSVMGFLDHTAVLSKLFRTLPTVFHGGCTKLHLYQKCIRLPLFPYPCQHLLLSVFLIITTVTGVRWYIIVVWICISKMLSDTEHFSLVCPPVLNNWPSTFPPSFNSSWAEISRGDSWRRHTRKWQSTREFGTLAMGPLEESVSGASDSMVEVISDLILNSRKAFNTKRLTFRTAEQEKPGVPTISKSSISWQKMHIAKKLYVDFNFLTPTHLLLITSFHGLFGYAFIFAQKCTKIMGSPKSNWSETSSFSSTVFFFDWVTESLILVGHTLVC